MTFSIEQRALKTQFNNLGGGKRKKIRRGKKETISNIYGVMNLFTWSVGKRNKYAMPQVVFWNGKFYRSLHAIQLKSMNSFIRLH